MFKLKKRHDAAGCCIQTVEDDKVLTDYLEIWIISITVPGINVKFYNTSKPPHYCAVKWEEGVGRGQFAWRMRR